MPRKSKKTDVDAPVGAAGAKADENGFPVSYDVPADTKPNDTPAQFVSVDPARITPGQNARMIPNPDQKQVVQARAIDIFKRGQLQPVECRRGAGDKLILDLGFTRYDAILLLRQGFEAVDPDTGEKMRFCKPDLLIDVRVVDVTEEEAFVRGLKENIERRDTTDLQEAKAQQKLRGMGWTDSRIAAFYGRTNQNRVMALKHLLALDKKTQNLVHEGKLSLYTAVENLAQIESEEERLELLAGAADVNTGKIRGEVLRDLIRGKIEKKAEKGEKEVSLKRTTKDLKRFIADAIAEDGEDTKPDAGVVAFLEGIVNFLDGKKGFGERKLKTLIAELS